jgi:hypothetical protein
MPASAEYRLESSLVVSPGRLRASSPGKHIATTGFHRRGDAIDLEARSIYPARLGLFTIPDLADDPQGRRLLDPISRIVEAAQMTICSAPASARRITVGIESPGIPEVIVELGRVERRCAMRFVQNPSFPLWVSAEKIHHELAHLIT